MNICHHEIYPLDGMETKHIIENVAMNIEAHGTRIIGSFILHLFMDSWWHPIWKAYVFINFTGIRS